MSEYADTSATAAAQDRAGFGARLGAYLIDVVIITIPVAIIYAIDASLANLASLLLGLAYFTYFEGSTGQTIGKRALSLRVVDARNESGAIGYGRAVIRYIGRIVSGLPLALGYLWMLWDGEKQTWHDKFASSYVVRS